MGDKQSGISCRRSGQDIRRSEFDDQDIRRSEFDDFGRQALTKSIVAAISMIARRNCPMARFSPCPALCSTGIAVTLSG